MKKAKIMLAAIVLFAVICGVLALNAKNLGPPLTLFAYTSSNTIAAYTAIGNPGCLKPIILPNATTTEFGVGVEYNASTTTYVTDEPDVCATFTILRLGE